MNNYQEDLIGMFLVKPQLLDLTILKPSYFDKKHRDIFTAIKKSYKENKTIILEDILAVKGIDVDLVIACSTSTATTALFEQYQDYAVKEYKKKALLATAKKLQNDEITIDEFYKDTNNFASLGSYSSTRLTKELLKGSITKHKNNIKFTRFSNLEKKLNLKENDFVILAGATGVGKSGIAINLLDDLSHNYPCVYFNFEMVEEELYQRLISINSKLNQKMLEQYETLPQKNMNVVNSAIDDISKRHIDIINHSSTLDKLRSFIMSYKSDKHFIVFVDHVGLIGVRAKNSYEKMTEVAKELRKMSLDNNCTIIGLCQLNREATKNAKQPNLSMLRDSGELEQSASKVIFVWKNEKDCAEDYYLVIEKNRSGPKSIIPIGYNKENQIAYELSNKRDLRT
ncbi:DnaB-like helicase C-terminal domain-containing protein [Thomasclavelia ramosa]|uniref:DnaB-like helicase C-terminal domain-containing protein n=3 Tax=Thomasclavelia ramosa TaxID=1547 RepID=UPI0026E016ED|nr:DnaB-like helicase C-terminal domain-containing protein [Thomasclavelia ramosa]MDO5867287.1 DnaB-like helicase C-terminal domain-containing protein [Thomasclavelia ramosa]MDO5870741.1 DnaB-like helicase C-terminal domain-containing protein [Thomasclavelia ramosa]MDO5899257.1 DnaB-like helicase C-terminal domain-containing protein [Thomasclavelia ramosa]